MIVTAKMLREHGACEEARDIFSRQWGEKVEITPGVCLDVATSRPFRLWISWFVTLFLHPKAQEAYDHLFDRLLLQLINNPETTWEERDYKKAMALWRAIQRHDQLNTKETTNDTDSAAPQRAPGLRGARA